MNNQNAPDNEEIMNEFMLVDTSPDKMEAYVTFTPPVGGGARLTSDEIATIIGNRGVTYGLDRELMNTLLSGSRQYGKPYVIARGDLPEDGIDGALEYFFDTEKKTYQPKVLDDGTVDYRNLDLIETAEEGQVLVRTKVHTKGADGMNVFGEIVPGREGRPAPKIPRGKNTSISEDGLELRADVAGQIVYLNKKVSVNKVLEIQGDVGVSTGNINFNGSIIIRGNVLTDYKIVALGNVEIYGIVEGAEILSEGNIIINKGINGMNKAQIEAKGNINALIIKDASVTAGGDIYADGIMHSNVKCGGKIEVNGKKGLLVGGKITAKEEINAKVIGSPMATVTDINVGIDASVYDKYKENMAEMGVLQKEYEELSKTIHSMSKIKELNNLPASKKNSYIKTIYDAQTVKKKLELLQDEILVLREELDAYRHQGKIKAGNRIYPGVNIQIGNAVMNIRDDIYKSLVVNEDGRVRIVSL